MSGINQSVVLDVCRIKVCFADDIGNEKRISGTGFWLKNGSSDVFVTNKHNVDASLTFGIETKYKLKELEIELREFHDKFPSSSSAFFQIEGIPSCIIASANADAAIIRDPTFTNPTGDFRHGRVLNIDDLADQNFFENKVQIMDIASFIGFPGKKMSQWWDNVWNLGIARMVNIASLPGIPFTHQDVSTSDVTIVSGLSFSGSSGSVVILHEKSICPGRGISNPGYVPPKILGIMSGHWPEPQTTPEMFSHSGLSYYTRSTAIIQLLMQPVT